jgi:hypothetical protein
VGAAVRCARKESEGAVTEKAEPTREQIAQDYARALAIIDSLRCVNAALLDALNCEPWHWVGQACDEEACFWCNAKRFSRPTDEAAHEADCPWAKLSPHATAVALRKYLE